MIFKSLSIIFLTMSLLIGCVQHEKTQVEMGTPLKFNPSGRFKIAQFTDIHWKPSSENNQANLNLIQLVIEEEMPDLVIYTGDIVTEGPSLKGWIDVTKPLVDADIPWTVTLGNHDDEADMTRDQIYDLLLTLPGFVGIKGPAHLSGTGNYVLPVISSSSDRIAAVIWCFDSHGYPENKLHGDYDWIKFDQIAWYRKTSTELTQKNSHTPLPALAYFHIPLPEFGLIAEKESTIGRFEEKVCSPDVNSGMFAAFLESGDVMGMFAGHDHVNNYIGTHMGIAMGYGQVSGADAYGNFPRGARLVEIYEGKRMFNSWIRTTIGVEYHFQYTE